MPLHQRSSTIAAAAMIAVVWLACPCHADEPKQIEIRPQWTIGERLQFEMISTREQSAPGRPAVRTKSETSVTAQAKESAQTGTIVEWKQISAKVVEPSQPNAFVASMLELKGLTALELDLLPSGKLQGVKNWRAVEEAADKRLELLAKDLEARGAKGEDVARFAAEIRSAMETQEGVEKLMADDAAVYFALSGQTVNTETPTEFETEVSSPFGGNPLPAMGKLTVIGQDAEKNTVTVRREQTVDPAECRRLFVEHLKAIAAQKGTPLNEARLPKSITIRSIAEYAIDLSFGLPREMGRQREVNIDGVIQFDALRIALVAKQR